MTKSKKKFQRISKKISTGKKEELNKIIYIQNSSNDKKIILIFKKITKIGNIQIANSILLKSKDLLILKSIQFPNF